MTLCHGIAWACLGEVMHYVKFSYLKWQNQKCIKTDLFSFNIVNFRQIFTGKLGLLQIDRPTSTIDF